MDRANILNILFKNGEHSALEMEEKGLETSGLVVSIQYIDIDIDIGQYFECLI